MSHSTDRPSGAAAALRRVRTLFALLPMTLLPACASAPPAPAGAPAARWLQYATPGEAGFSSAALEEVRQRADSARSGAFMAVYRGRVLAAYGDVARELELHSVRKSLVSALYGTAVAAGEVDLDATLGQLGIDDIEPLTEVEKGARVRDLLASRSGVYHPAAYSASDQDESRPARGSHAPGSHFFYNNWDFNVAGVIWERSTGQDPYRAFEERIAEPLGMQDFDAGDGFRVYEPSFSRHPAHTIRMSARDLARFGQLYLQRGRWGGRQVLPEWWVEESTRPHTDFGDGSGYGWMWWTYAAGWLPAERYPTLSRYDLYMGRGTGGQAVFLIPDAELVVVHRGDTDHDRGVGGPAVWGMVEGVLAARVGEPSARPRLIPLPPTPLVSQLPPLAPRRTVEARPEALAEYVGRYALGPDAVVRVTLWEGRPFIFVPGEGEAELLPIGPDLFTIHVVAGVSVRFERGDDGRVDGVVLTLGDQIMRARRLP